MTIRLVTFDLDNTLWEVDPVIVEAERRMRAWLVDSEPDAAALYQPDTLLELRDEVLRALPDLRHDVSALRLEILRRLLLRAGRHADRAQQSAARAFEIFLKARHEVSLYPGVDEVIAHLAERYTLGALTNGNADIRQMPIGKRFAIVHTSASVGASKPAADMFLAALSEAGVAPEQAVHIGDHPVDDIAAAQAVGMRTIWYTGSALRQRAADKPDQPPCAVTDRIHDIPRLIANLAEPG